MAKRRDYYYAGGERIDLDADAERVAVDTKAPHLRNVVDSRTLSHLARQGQEIRRGIRLLARSDLPDEIARLLDAEGLTHPVYRYGKTLLVVLPEVMVEGDDPKQVAAIRRFLKGKSTLAEIVEEEAGQFLLRPRSGRGEDALKLANEISEALHPALAEARFLRVTPRPGVKKKKAGRKAAR